MTCKICAPLSANRSFATLQHQTTNGFVRKRCHSTARGNRTHLAWLVFLGLFTAQHFFESLSASFTHDFANPRGPRFDRLTRSHRWSGFAKFALFQDFPKTASYQTYFLFSASKMVDFFLVEKKSLSAHSTQSSFDSKQEKNGIVTAGSRHRFRT